MKYYKIWRSWWWVTGKELETYVIANDKLISQIEEFIVDTYPDLYVTNISVKFKEEYDCNSVKIYAYKVSFDKKIDKFFERFSTTILVREATEE